MPTTDADLPIHYQFIKGSEYIALADDGETWLIEPLIPAGGWVNIYGKPKKGRKSYLALGMAWAISTGQPQWIGFDVRSAGPVLFLQADTPRPLWRQRMLDLSDAGYDMSGIHVGDIKSIPYPFNIAEHAEILHEMVEEVRQAEGMNPLMIVLDTARKLHRGDENSSQDSTILMDGIEMATGPDMAKILITHDKKGGALDPKRGDEDDPDTQVDLMEGARGSTAIAGAVDTVIKMTPKGYMWYQGRAVGEERKKLRFQHVGGKMGYMWEEDIAPEVEEAKKLVSTYTTGSERSLARMLAKSQHIEEEAARSIIRRQKRRA